MNGLWAVAWRTALTFAGLVTVGDSEWNAAQATYAPAAAVMPPATSTNNRRR